jgi:diguanylate cyclase (GGDEF)-like protein/PAS domain S-box-containing protein
MRDEGVLPSGPIDDIEEAMEELAGAADEVLRAEAECRELEFRTLAENTPDLIARIDRGFRFLFVNPALAEASRMSADQLTGRKWREIGWPPGILEFWENALSRVFQTGRGEIIEFEYPPERNGRFYHVRIVPERDEENGVSYVILIARDITERKEAEDALRESENRLRVVIENSPDQLFQQDRSLRYTWVPEARIKGFPEMKAGMTDADLFPPEEAAFISSVKRKVLETGEGSRMELRFNLHGEEKYFDAFFEPWRDPRGRVSGIIGYVRDITERKQAQRLLEESERRYLELSITDSLTGLHNLRYFYERVKEEIERVNRYHFPLCVLMLDVDNFKSINDRFGHAQGDYALYRAAEIIRGHIRQVDSAYRYGGEEFMVILPETESEDAIQVAERIRISFRTEDFSPKMDERLHLTVSIGVAKYFPKEDLISFLRRVDENMYIAKSQGKDRVFFQEGGAETGFLM